MRELGAVRKALFNRLSTYSPIAVLLTNTDDTVRVYPYSAPERRAFPYILIIFESANESFVLGDAEPIYTRPIYMIKAVAETLLQANELSTLIADALRLMGDTQIEEEGTAYYLNNPIRKNLIEYEERATVGQGVKRYYHSGARYQIFIQPVI